MWTRTGLWRKLRGRQPSLSCGHSAESQAHHPLISPQHLGRETPRALRSPILTEPGLQRRAKPLLPRHFGPTMKPTQPGCRQLVVAQPIAEGKAVSL